MTEWGVIGVIIALVGLLAVILRPIVSLNTSITRLTTLIDGLSGNLRELTTDNKHSHDRIWKKNEEQDTAIDDHEHRITVLETKGSK